MGFGFTMVGLIPRSRFRPVCLVCLIHNLSQARFRMKAITMESLPVMNREISVFPESKGHHPLQPGFGGQGRMPDGAAGDENGLTDGSEFRCIRIQATKD
jgi:hypothetical protein